MKSLLLWLSVIVAALINATLLCWSCRFGDFMRPPIQVWPSLPNVVLYLEKEKKTLKGQMNGGRVPHLDCLHSITLLVEAQSGKAVCGWSGLTFPCLCLVMQQPWQRKVLLQAAALKKEKFKRNTCDEMSKISIIWTIIQIYTATAWSSGGKGIERHPASRMFTESSL